MHTTDGCMVEKRIRAVLVLGLRESEILLKYSRHAQERRETCGICDVTMTASLDLRSWLTEAGSTWPLSLSFPDSRAKIELSYHIITISSK